MWSKRLSRGKEIKQCGAAFKENIGKLYTGPTRRSRAVVAVHPSSGSQANAQWVLAVSQIPTCSFGLAHQKSLTESNYAHSNFRKAGAGHDRRTHARKYQQEMPSQKSA